MKHLECTSDYPHIAHTFPGFAGTVKCEGMTPEEKHGVQPSYEIHQTINTSPPKHEPAQLEKAKIVRYTKDEGIVVQIDGTDYSLEWVGELNLNVTPGDIPALELRIHAPTLEIYLP